MLVNLPTSHSNFTLPDIDKLATDTGFIVRESSKMNASNFTQTIISASISGKGSYNQLASSLGKKTGDPMSRQGMEKRFISGACVEFLTKVHEGFLKAQISSAESSITKSKISRLIVEDCTIQSMPKSNADDFRGHGNHLGKTAGVKVDFAFDILSNTVTNHSLHGATESDKSIGKEAVVELREGDLSLRDMGYFKMSEFTYIESIGANWLTRLPVSCEVFMDDGKSLEKHLKTTAKNEFNATVYAGASERKKCRLVAVRADKKTADKRRRDRKAKAKKNGKSVSQRSLVRDGWHIMLTNLDEADFSIDDLVVIYRIRWGVEIQYRAWKQSSNLDAVLNRKSKENHMMALILGGMLAHLIANIVSRIFSDKIELSRMSFEKLSDALADHHCSAKSVEDILTFRVDPRHIKRDKRSAVTPFRKGLSALG